MNKEWSEKNKEFQKLISKEATFKDGIKMLLELRASVFEQITQIVDGYPEKAFYEMRLCGCGKHKNNAGLSVRTVCLLSRLPLLFRLSELDG